MEISYDKKKGERILLLQAPSIKQSLNDGCIDQWNEYYS